jgi:GT2 family glycosyltransferase
MKDVVVAVCTPDLARIQTQTCLGHLAATDLSRAELVVVDNRCDPGFRHAATMDRLLRYADDRPIVFVDDDVQIGASGWLDALRREADAHDALIAGCEHTTESGEVSHTGVLVHTDGTTRLLRERPADAARHRYVPALSSALLLVRDPAALGFDVAFEKYQHDTDICLEAWRTGGKVICHAGLRVVHLQGGVMNAVSGFRAVFARDSERFASKWSSFAAGGLYDRPELSAFRAWATDRNWEADYNRAARLIDTDPAAAAHRFAELIESQPPSRMAGSAYYHLFRLVGGVDHLERCVACYPEHRAAQEALDRIARGAPR